MLATVGMSQLRYGLGTIKLWDFPSLQLANTFRWHQVDDGNLRVLFSPDGQVLVAKVFEGYACARTGRVHESDALVAVNGQPTTGLTVGEVYALLRRALQAAPNVTLQLE